MCDDEQARMPEGSEFQTEGARYSMVTGAVLSKEPQNC